MAVALPSFFLELALVQAVALELVGLLTGDVQGAFAAAWANTFLKVGGANVFEIQFVVMLQGFDHF
ncbi:hypothetical protein [Pseudomonas sp. RA_15y_Pfl2_54]|uniref:hypothetical protein n=1 Tax=Pseudomonas sp. RA_15y_Pfl2_54 TaxID=3088704 RepID=UPI0030D7C0B6